MIRFMEIKLIKIENKREVLQFIKKDRKLIKNYKKLIGK